VLPCAPRGQVMIDWQATIAPNGMPDAIPLAEQTMSGSTPTCWTGHILPVRPMPDCTSSTMSRMLCRLHTSRRRGRKLSGGMM
jgi:hypothetical protein